MGYAVTPEQIGNLTLADLDAIAARLSGAVQAIREAQQLLGGGATSAPIPSPVRAESAPPPDRPQVANPEQQKALDDWRNSPARKKLLEQVRGTNEGELPAAIAAVEASDG